MTKSRRLFVFFLTFALVGGLGLPNALAHADETVLVGGAVMSPAKTIADNVSTSKDHTTLVEGLKAADLMPTLQSKGPYTLFAPTNAAFDKLPHGVLDMLMKPENKVKLVAVLGYHVVPGHLTLADLEAKADANGGQAILTTLEGDTLTVSKDSGGDWAVADTRGGRAIIMIPDVLQSNGVLFVINNVLLPSK